MAKRILLTSLLILFAAQPFARAGYDYRYDAKDGVSEQFESSMSAKLTRGITNILFGWTELGRTPVRMAAGPEHGKLFATVFGVPAGIFKMAQRTLVGAYEVVTFYVPQSPVMPEIEGDVV